MAIKTFVIKLDKCYVKRKGSRLTSAQSSITGLYSIRYSPFHIINSCSYVINLFIFLLDILRQMLQQAKNDGLTINVRHAKVLICGAPRAGKTNFGCLLRNQKLEEYYSTSLGPVTQLSLLKKINVIGTEWITLDSKLETQLLTERLIAKLQNYKAKQIDSNIPQQNSDITESFTLTTEKLQSNLTSVEEQMINCNLEVMDSVVPDTWDMITMLDINGSPEFLNLLPAFNTSTAITFIVLNLSDGEDCLNNLVVARYNDDGYDYHKHDLNYTNMQLLKSLLSSVKITALKKEFHPDIVSEDMHTKAVVCCIGTHADVLKLKVGEKYDEVLNMINKEIRQLAKEITEDNQLIFWCDAQGNFVIPIDNTIPRFQENESAYGDFYQTATNIQRIREQSNRILKSKAQYEIPISWFILELELRNSDKVCIPLTEVKEISDKIMPSHRKMNMYEIIEILKFYHFLGTLLYFSEVDGMRDFVITNPQWLFTEITKIIMCKFQNNELYGLRQINRLHNGICDVDLLRKLDLDLQSVNLESFINLLVHLQIIAPIQNGDYFIPNILPQCSDAENIFTEAELGKPAAFSSNGECITPEVEPLMITFTNGTIPRGCFGFLVVQLIQSDVGFKLYGQNSSDKQYRYANLVIFHIEPHYFVSFYDRISYLEVQVRVQGNHPSYHYKIQSTVTEALETVFAEFNWQFDNCRYGYICHEHYGSFKHNHLTLLPSFHDKIPEYAYCKYQKPTRLSQSHRIWFEVRKNVYTYVGVLMQTAFTYTLRKCTECIVWKYFIVCGQ